MDHPPETETATANGQDTGRNIGARLAKIGRRTAWVVPVTAIATITLSALQLEITPDAWQKPVADAIDPVAALKTDPLVCLTAGSVMLTYWLARDGWDAIIKGSIMIGIKTAWQQVKEEIRAKAHAEGRALGHTEGHTEGRALGHTEGHTEGHALGHTEGHTEGRTLGHTEGRAEVYAELKGKTLSEIAAELGIDAPPGANGHNTPPSDNAAGRPENAC